MTYLRTACSVRRLDSDSNESVYNWIGMTCKGEEKKCGVMEGSQVQYSTLKWFGHTERMDESKYMSKIDVVGAKGRKIHNEVGGQG